MLTSPVRLQQAGIGTATGWCHVRVLPGNHLAERQALPQFVDSFRLDPETKKEVRTDDPDLLVLLKLRGQDLNLRPSGYEAPEGFSREGEDFTGPICMFQAVDL
jgi:uncharacterized ferredoxin-like protein